MTENEQESNFEDLWARPGFLIRRLHQVHVGMFLEECEKHNVTPAQFAVLTVLYYQGTLDQVSISSQIGFDRNTVADVIHRLERRGLITRPVSTTDKRAKLAQITESGKKFVDAVQPNMIKAQKRLVGPLSDREYATLMKLLDKLLSANNDASRAPLHPSKKA